MTSPNPHAESIRRIRSNPKFAQLAKSRSILSWGLCGAVFVLYYVFMFVVALSPETLHSSISEGGKLTWGIPVAAFVIVGSWLLTGWYVSVANNKFDQMSKEILEESK